MLLLVVTKGTTDKQPTTTKTCEKHTHTPSNPLVTQKYTSHCITTEARKKPHERLIFVILNHNLTCSDVDALTNDLISGLLTHAGKYTNIL